MYYNIIGNDKCECLKNIMIGQSAAKFHCEMKKVQRLVGVSFYE